MKRQPSLARIRHANQARRLAYRIEAALKDHASAWETFKLPMEDLSDRMTETEMQLGTRRLPLYYQGRIAATRDMLRESIIRRHAEWRVNWRGREYSSVKGSIAPSTDEIITGTWHETLGEAGRMVWLGTDRDFYRPKVSR